MDDFASFFPDLLAFSALLLVALAAAPLAQRLRLPAPAAFLAVGIVAGLAGLNPAEDLSRLALEEIGAIALYAILFQGGLSTGFAAFRRHAAPILLLGLPGTVVAAAALSAVGHFVLGLDWSLAALVGIALAPTDPAAVYAVLRGGKAAPARSILEGESGFNDPVGISLMVVAIAMVGNENVSLLDGAATLGKELGIGLAGGIFGGMALIGLLRATPWLEGTVHAVALVTGAMIVGATTASLHGSGFLAVYLAGLLVSDEWSRRKRRHRAIPEVLAGVAEPVLFGLLGAAFAPVVIGGDIWRGIVLTVATVLFIRPLVATACLRGSGLRRPERLLVSWGGLKGAVPLLLAAYPALEQLDVSPRVEGIVLVATAASIVLQGVTLSYTADRLALVPPRRRLAPEAFHPRAPIDRR